MNCRPFRHVLACLLLAPLGLAPATSPAPGDPLETRGTWITTTANDAISTPATTAETMKRLADMGFNTVYVECWKNGYTEFPSATMRKLVGVEMKVNNAPAELQRDLLAEAVAEARKNGLRPIAWFEYGFMAAHKDTDNELRRLAEQEGWLTRTRDGKLVGEQNPFVWMNPLHPVPQQLLIDIVLEAVEKYDLEGVQLDDRIALPVEMGYDDYTKALYAKEHAGRMPPDDPRDAAWVQWRADKVTAYARRFAEEIRRRKPGLIVSVSPAPYPWSLENYACDWPTWMTWRDDAGRPLWDEALPQCYRFNFASFEANWREQVEAMKRVAPDRLDSLIAGIRVVGDGPDTPWPDVARKMALSESLGGGYCIWFSRAVLEVYPAEFETHLKDRDD